MNITNMETAENGSNVLPTNTVRQAMVNGCATHKEMSGKDLGVEGITLLSVREYMACRNNIKPISWSWWLRSPGISSSTVAYIKGIDVNFEGDDSKIDVFGCHASCDRLEARPALRLNSRKASVHLSIGKSFEMAGYTWTIIADDLALCDSGFGLSNFNSRKSSNVYADSDIRQYLENWALVNDVIPLDSPSDKKHDDTGDSQNDSDIAKTAVIIAAEIPEIMKEIRTLSATLKERNAHAGKSLSDITCGNENAPEIANTKSPCDYLEKIIHMDAESLLKLGKKKFFKRIARMAWGDKARAKDVASYEVIRVENGNILVIKVRAKRGHFTEDHVVTVIEHRTEYILLKDANGSLYKIAGSSIYGKGETLDLRIKEKEDMSGYWLVKVYELSPHVGKKSEEQ